MMRQDTVDVSQSRILDPSFCLCIGPLSTQSSPIVCRYAFFELLPESQRVFQVAENQQIGKYLSHLARRYLKGGLLQAAPILFVVRQKISGNRRLSECGKCMTVKCSQISETLRSSNVQQQNS